MLKTTRTATLPLSFLNQEHAWTPDRSGTYAEQNARGRAYADELVVEIRLTGNTTLFGSVLRSIAAAGTYEGVEVGFASRIGNKLIC